MQQHPSAVWSRLGPALGAALVLLVGMGMGRFAFTGLYPLMVHEGVLSVGGGSLAASANYGGYLAGAVLAGALLGGGGSGWSRRVLCQLALIATVVGLALLVLPLPEWAIIVVRTAAGVASAFAMIAASQWLMHDRQQGASMPALFAAVGFGIFTSSELIALAQAWGVLSGAIWLLLAGAGAVLTVVSALLMAAAERVPVCDAVTAPAEAAAEAGVPTVALSAVPAVPALPKGPAPTVRTAVPAGGLPAGRLTAAYGLAGFGYIITATYLPLLVRDALGGINPVHVWALFGLMAVPSCFLWHHWHERWGTRRTLIANLLVQAVGVVLPALAHAPLAYLASAALVGGTCLGTVTIVISAGRHLAAGIRFNLVALMTAAYGFGQIVGPLVAGAIYARTHEFAPSLLLAAAALLLGVGLCWRRVRALA